MIVVDSLSVRMSAYGGEIPTPHLERLARSGRRFDRAYSPYPAAGPATMALLTGWRPPRSGVWDEKQAPPAGAPNLHAHFEAGGYFSARAGRHLGGSAADEADPAAALERLVAQSGSRPFFVTLGISATVPTGRAADPASEPGPAAGPEIPAIAAADLAFLDRPGRRFRPAALTPAEVRRRLVDETDRAAKVDAMVGRLLTVLDRRQLWPRTVVVFVAAAPPDLGAHGRLPRSDTLFEASLRTPLVIVAPGLAKPGTPTTALSELVDLPPTLLELCGLPPIQALDGISLTPVLQYPFRAARPAAFSVVSRRAGEIARSVRSARHRYSEWPDGSEELYDHDTDPREHVNLARSGSPPDTLAAMRSLLDARSRLEPAKAASSGAEPGAAPAPKLNVLLILVDDLNVHLGAYGHPVQTPNIDRLARMGRRFDRAYAQVAMCSPSRISLLTGRRPERLNVWHNRMAPDLGDAVPLQEHFRRHGYFTAHAGKVYERATGEEFRWDEVALPEPPEDEEVAWARAARRARPSFFTMTDRPDEREPDGKRARLMAGLIERHRGRPFFLVAGFVKPHLRWVAPRKYFDLYPPAGIRFEPAPADDHQDIPAIAVKNRPQERPQVMLSGRESAGMLADPAFGREAVAAYHACVTFIDAQVGILLDTLDRFRLWPRTVVVLMADHGHHLGEHGGLWRKDPLFEEALRAPLIVVAPQVRQPGAPADGPVEYLDLYPTLVELAGLPAPAGLDGVSLLPALADPRHSPQKGALSFRRAPAPPLGASVRTERYRYTEWPDGSQELYDHLDDPGETRNLAGVAGRDGTREALRKLLEEVYRPMRPS